MKKYLGIGIYILYILFMFVLLSLFDIVFYDKVDIVENITMTSLIAILEYLFIDALTKEKKLKINTKFYIINLIIIILIICFYNFVKIVANKYAKVNENVLDYSISETLIMISKEKYKSNEKDYIYSQSHKLLGSEEKDNKIYTYVAAEYGKCSDKCKCNESTFSTMTIIFDKVKNGMGTYNFNKYIENEIPDKYKESINEESEEFLQKQIIENCNSKKNK